MHVVLLLVIALAISGLLVTASPRPAWADWPPCSPSSGGAGDCVPVYPSGGITVGAKLAGPTSLSVSPANCPKGSFAAQNGYSCSIPVTYSLAIPSDRVGVYNIHFNGPLSETNTNIVYNFTNVTPEANGYSIGWCDIDPTTAGCKGSNTTSLPLYLVVVHPAPSDVALTCVIGQYPNDGGTLGGDEFGGCIQIDVTNTPKNSTTTTTTMPRGHTITGTIDYYYADGDSFARGVSGGPTQITPSRETKVEVLGSSKSSCSTDVLDSVDTNDSGKYTSAVSAKQKYVCLKVIAETIYSEIIPYSSSVDVSGGAVLTDDAYASKALGPIKISTSGPTKFSWKPTGYSEPIDQALDIDNALIAGALWLSDYGMTPKFVNILYPYPESTTTNFNPGKLRGEINQDDAFDWGVLLHEYGHFIASQIGILNTTRLSSSDHSLAWNMANANHEADKAQGLAIAWNEGFADFFSQMVQSVMGTASLGLTDVGGSPPIYVDYTSSDTTEFQLNVPGNSSPYPSLGEDNEAAVARVLWYLYSQPIYPGVDGSVDFVKTLANTMTSNDSRTLYGAVSALLAAAKATPWVPSAGDSATNEEVPANFDEATSAKTYGEILSIQNVAPTITASGASGKSVTLSWTTGQPSTAKDELNVFLVQFFNSSWTTLLSEQTVMVSSRTKDKMHLFTATKVIPSDWTKGNINVVVLGWNSADTHQPLQNLTGTSFLTGPYISAPVSVNIG